MIAQLGIIRIPSIDEGQVGVELDDVGVVDAAVKGPCRVEDGVSATRCHSGGVTGVDNGVQCGLFFRDGVVVSDGTLGAICREDNHLGVRHGASPAEAKEGTFCDLGVQIDEVSVWVVKHEDSAVVADSSVAKTGGVSGCST